MNFILLKASDGSEKKIEVNSIKDIMKLIHEYQYPIIISDKTYYYNYPTITIYDDYIE